MSPKHSMLPINRAVGRWLVPLFLWGGVSANTITLGSLLAGLLGGWWCSRGTPAAMLWGALGFLVANILDECDGQVARRTGTVSSFGAWLDTVTDSAVHIALFLGLAVGLHRQMLHGPWFWLGGVAAAGSLLSLALDVGGPAAWPSAEGGGRDSRLARLTEWFRIDFSLLVMASALVRQMGWILWAGSIGVFAIWIPSTLAIAARARR